MKLSARSAGTQNPAVAKKIAPVEKRTDEPHDTGRDRGSCGLEALVASRARRHRAPTHEPKADRRDRGADQPGRQAMQHLGEDDEVKCRSERIDQGGARERGDAAGDEEALVPDPVGERAAGNEADDGREATDRQYQADIRFRPVQAGEVECYEGAEARLHVRDEEIGPVKSQPAARRNRLAQGSAGLSVFCGGLAER